MGYSMHHTIVVTSWDEGHINSCHKRAKDIFGDKVSDILSGYVNRQYSFFVAPDGSKEGWAESDEGDARRTKFLAWMHTIGPFYVDWIEVCFGGDFPVAKVVRHSGEDPERDEKCKCPLCLWWESRREEPKDGK